MMKIQQGMILAIMMSLIILNLGGCDTMGKPTETLEWIAAGRTDDPAGIRTDGYKPTDRIPSYQHNWIFKNVTEWQQFVDRAFGKTYYVKCASGDDTNGDGSSTYPFKTIKKAVDLIEDGGYGTIIRAESGDYPISDDISFTNKRVNIISDSLITATCTFESYTKSGKNWLYQITMSGYSYLYIDGEVIIDDPADAGDDWYNFASAIVINEGYSTVYFNDLTFSATPATGNEPHFVLSNGTAMVSSGGTITTNSLGYVLHARNKLQFANFSTIDDVAYKGKGLLSQNQKLSTGALGTSIGAFKVKINSQLTTNETASLPSDSIAANIATAIEGLINANIKSGSVDVAVTLVDVDGFGNILEMELEIKGIYSGKRLPFELVFVGVGHEGVFEEIQAPKPLGYNVITN